MHEAIIVYKNNLSVVISWLAVRDANNTGT
jgi:hypothetical protein